MRLSTPRIEPVDLDTATPEQREQLEPFAKTMGLLNIFRTMARTPKALKRFNVWAGYIMGHGTSLPPREREIAILRTGWLCRAGYEWVQHRRIGSDCGLTDAEIEAIKVGAEAPGWSPRDAAILAATEDLVRDHFVSDARWAALDALSEAQRMDLVYTVGQYTTVSMLLNTFGVQLDEGQTLDPDFPRG
jgi:4-carboxymuconolactone decarboxylase